MELKYTDEKNVLLLIALLKANGIRRIIISPGSTNFTFVGSVQHDDYFELYSCVDERSAAYMACGMAEETGEPVVISCTGSTAPRNYLPGLTEAYYRKLPILAICGHRGISAIGHLHDQQLDRRNEPVDVANVQVWLPFVKDEEDERLCYNEITKAILALRAHGGGPAMINMCTHYSQNMTVQETPHVKKLGYYTPENDFPDMPQGRIAIAIGSHKRFTKEEISSIDAFCAAHDAVVFCDHTSGYYGKYAVHSGLIFGQDKTSELSCVDLCISVGEISGDTMGMLRVWSPEAWRINEDGIYRNRTNNVTNVFEMSLAHFCKRYIVDGVEKDDFLGQCRSAYQEVYMRIPDIPFSNVWVAQQLAKSIPNGSSIYFGIYNSLRSWNLFELPKGVEGMCNVGGFGIDGTLSSAVGRALANQNRITYCVLGDLAFFYDLNALGNRHIGNNLRILMINNGLGDEFRIYDSHHRFLGEEVRPYICAEGHYGHQSKELVKSYAESLGYTYITASNKTEFNQLMPLFVEPELTQSIIFEVMIRPEDDTDALDMVKHIVLKDKETSLKKKIKKAIKSKIGDEKIEAIRTLLK